MGSFKFFFRIAITTFVIVISFCFLLYPAFLPIRLVQNAEFRRGEITDFTLRWFRGTSKRFVKWANHYLETQQASLVSHENVAATEWPMFGSVFYLLTAEEIQCTLGQRNDQEAEDISRELLKGAEAAVRIVVDPTTATWVHKKWGSSYLTKENVFYRMLLIMGLSSYERITHKTTYRELLTAQSTSLAQELLGMNYHLLDDYPGECYPNDVVWAVAAILRTDQLIGTDHSPLADKLMEVLNTVSLSDEVLPAFRVNSKTGVPIIPSRGSGNSGILIFAPVLNRKLAQRWYHQYEKHFWQDNGFLIGYREFSRGSPVSSFQDVDSGPVVWGFGSVATAFGIGAARSLGRFDHAIPLTLETVICSWPTPFGFAIPSFMGWMAVNASPLGEVALLFSMTRPILVSDIFPYLGKIPGIIWAASFFYLVMATYLLFTEYRSWRKWLHELHKN